MLTLSVPVGHNKKFVGVAAVDVLREDLLEPLVYQRLQENAYTFVVNHVTGHALYHPLLPEPKSPGAMPSSVDIRDLERYEGFEEIYKTIQ